MAVSHLIFYVLFYYCTFCLEKCLKLIILFRKDLYPCVIDCIVLLVAWFSTNNCCFQTSQNSTEQQQIAKSEEDVNESVISVKDRAKHLNKIQSESELRLQSESNLRRKDVRQYVNIKFCVLEQFGNIDRFLF